MTRDLWQPVRVFGKGPWSLLPRKTWSFLTDVIVFATGLSLFYGTIVLARTWFGPFNPRVEISRSPWMLPLYAAYSLLRITIAYVLSLAFTLVYGYIAAYNTRAERFMIPLLDILQSIPVLSFLPGGKRLRVYSINAMRARRPAWFQEDLERLLGLLAAGAIRPRIAGRISFEEVAEAHRRLEAGGLDGKLVLCPDGPTAT